MSTSVVVTTSTAEPKKKEDSQMQCCNKCELFILNLPYLQ